jgi:hypothetical protein
MQTVKAKDLKREMIIELPDIAPGFKPGLVTITQIEFEAPHIVEVSFYHNARYMADLYHPEAEFKLISK